MNNPSTKNGVFIKEFVAPTILIIAISLRLEKTLSLVVFEIIITLTVPSATISTIPIIVNVVLRSLINPAKSMGAFTL